MRGGWIKVGKILGVGAIASLAFCAGSWKKSEDEMRDGRAYYQAGRYVGKIMGGCDTLKSVARANPDSEWAHRPNVVAALSTCENLPPEPAWIR